MSWGTGACFENICAREANDAAVRPVGDRPILRWRLALPTPRATHELRFTFASRPSIVSDGNHFPGLLHIHDVAAVGLTLAEHLVEFLNARPAVHVCVMTLCEDALRAALP